MVVWSMPVKKHFHLLIFFIPGGLFTGGMAYIVQGNAFGFSNITLLALLPAFMVDYQSIEGEGSILWIDVPMGRDQMPDQKIAEASSS